MCMSEINLKKSMRNLNESWSFLISGLQAGMHWERVEGYYKEVGTRTSRANAPQQTRWVHEMIVLGKTNWMSGYGITIHCCY